MNNNTTSIYNNYTLDIDDNETLRGDKSICKGIDLLIGREPMNYNVANNDGNMREFIVNVPNMGDENTRLTPQMHTR